MLFRSRENFAKLCGFKGQSRTLSVTTLGNVTTEHLTVIEYDCLLRDRYGKMMSFKAYGLEHLTGQVTQMSANKLTELFPGVPLATLNQMLRGSRVDVLIGLGHFSWQPKRKIRASGGGDFWLCENRFGTCYGGRHPEVYEGTKRSDDLFTVNVDHSAFFAQAMPAASSPRFCSSSVKLLSDTADSSVAAPSEEIAHSSNTGADSTTVQRRPNFLHNADPDAVLLVSENTDSCSNSALLDTADSAAV